MKKIKPTKKQLEFLNWEMGVFFHFGIRTFNEGHRDWDGKEMKVSSFNPTELDCEQWIKTISEAGAKYALLTTKHHDGFALWPSKYTEYGVKNSPWKGGSGDVVKEYTDACRKYGIKVGLYYSPAQFGSREMQGKEYDDYFINQITELLSDYGKIDYLWFDGCGSEDHEYDKDRIVHAIRSLQPDILIFSMWDPDTRWVGNEEGMAAVHSRYCVKSQATSIRSTKDEAFDSEVFLPYECDCRIRPNSWFYSENNENMLLSADEIMGLYDYSIGRGGNLLINIAPDRRGLLPEKDAAEFLKFSKILKERFSSPLDVKIEKDGDLYTVTSEDKKSFDTIVIEEDITDGESCEAFEISYGRWANGHVLYEGRFIGHKRIITLPRTILFSQVRLMIKITAHSGDCKIKSITLY